MKTRMLVMPGLLLAILGGLGTSAPAPPAGRPKELASFKAHLVVQDLAFSPDGKTLASAGRDSTIKLWEVGSWKKLAEIQAHSPNPARSNFAIVNSVAFSPDGKTVASSGEDRKVKFWDVATGRNTDTLEGLAPPLLFSRDGNRLAVGHLLWDLKTGKWRNVWKGFTDLVEATAFDDKGKLLVVTATIRPKPPTFTLWDAEAGKEVVTFKGHAEEVMRVAFSPDRKTVASASLDHTIRLWDVATGKNLATFKDHPGRTCALVFSPDGKVLAAGYKHQEADGKTDAHPRRGSVRLYETATGRVLATLAGKPGPIAPLAFSPDGVCWLPATSPEPS